VQQISTDDKQFEEIYRSLLFKRGLVIVAFTAKSLRAQHAFFLSLKEAAIRCGSDVLLFSGGIPLDMDAVAIQIQESGARLVHMFVMDRFEAMPISNLVARLSNERGFDMFDGSIHPSIAQILQQSILGSNFTMLVPTIATKEGQIRARRVARFTGREQGVFIAIEHAKFLDDWYSVTVTTGADEQKFMIYF